MNCISNSISFTGVAQGICIDDAGPVCYNICLFIRETTIPVFRDLIRRMIFYGI